jgi:hypothetical protein
MLILAIVSLFINPFYDANFTPLPARSISLFSNPSGLGINTGAEAFATYHFDTEIITAGASARNLGFGFRKADTLHFYQIAAGYRLPGAFSLGYAYEFGDTSIHLLGVECRPSPQLSLGYKTTLGHTKHMFGGISIMPYREYVTLSFEMEYEGIEDTLTFYYGARIIPYKGISACFMADKEFNWHAGIELALGYTKITGMYSYEEEKFSAGLIISAQRYETFISE